MARFLDLPLELRELIYVAVLNSQVAPPSSPSGFKKAEDPEKLWPGMGKELFEGCNEYAVDPVMISSANFLRANRQIHSEFTNVINRAKARSNIRFKLDCMMENEQYIYPSWTAVSVVTTHVDELKVNFRLFGECKEFVHGCRSQWLPREGGPGSMIWSLMALLTRFLLRGPNFLAARQPQGPHITIGELVLNVITPSHVPMENLMREDDPVFWGGRPRERGLLIHPAIVLRMMHTHLGHILDGPRQTDLQRRWYQSILDMCIGQIKFCIDGLEKAVWDLEEIRQEREKSKSYGNVAIVPIS